MKTYYPRIQRMHTSTALFSCQLKLCRKIHEICSLAAERENVFN